MIDFSVEQLAEDALLLRFGDTIDVATNARVHAVARALRVASLSVVTDIAPAYASLLVRFDPLAMGPGSFLSIDALRNLIEQTHVLKKNEPDPIAAVVEIPVCYGGDCGPDLAAVAMHTGLSLEEVVARHAAAEYTVAMLGFAPGFPYLLGLDPSLHMPRRANPRTHVPTGSVAIGGAQTGIYPNELPGGWHLIGRTPAVLFDPQRDPPALFAPGDRVRLRAIAPDEYLQRAGLAA